MKDIGGDKLTLSLSSSSCGAAGVISELTETFVQSLGQAEP